MQQKKAMIIQFFVVTLSIGSGAMFVPRYCFQTAMKNFQSSDNGD